jgi:hypothetical protein
MRPIPARCIRAAAIVALFAGTPAAAQAPETDGTATPPAAVSTAPAGSAPAKSTPSSSAPAKRAAGREAPRTLEDIRIEGDVPVPQVLFITARDQRRFMDLHHRRYLQSSLQIGERTVVPTSLTVLRKPISGERKETSP